MTMPAAAGLALIASLLLPAGAVAAVHGSHAPGTSFDEPSALRVSQAAIGRRLGDYRFTDSDGTPVALAQFRGKPIVVSLIYTSCAHVCPTITQTLARSVALARAALGEASFTVLTVGFDSAVDTPAQLRRYAAERGVLGTPGWHFLATDAATMQRLAGDLGFIYYASPKGYDHLSQTTIVDATGVVYRQVYGERYALPTLVEPLKQLVYGTRANASSLDGILNGVRLFCTVFDPASGRYTFDYSLPLAVLVGLASLGAVAVFIVRAWREGRAART